MRFALLGKCFAVGERVERMETLEFEEVRIYRINVSGRNCEPRPPRMGHFERVGMLIVAMLNFELLRAFFFVTFIALIICFFHGFSILDYDGMHGEKAQDGHVIDFPIDIFH